jgi:hypothetical protein
VNVLEALYAKAQAIYWSHLPGQNGIVTGQLFAVVCPDVTFVCVGAHKAFSALLVGETVYLVAESCLHIAGEKILFISTVLINGADFGT